MIRVVSARHSLPGIYIGRSHKGWFASPLGNPFHAKSNRPLALSLYREWITTKIAENDPIVMKELQRIKAASLQPEGVNLICWCKPHKACHGDIIKEIVEAMP